MVVGGTFEALNYALRKSKGGVIISFVVHPSDIDAALTALPIGARVAIKWVEITDEQPSGDGAPPTSSPTAAPQSGGSVPAATSSKERKRFDELPLSQQCAIRCGDSNFWEYWKETRGWTIESETEMAGLVREMCDIKSRSELNIDQTAAEEWRDIERGYQSWITTKAHAHAYR